MVEKFRVPAGLGGDASSGAGGRGVAGLGATVSFADVVDRIPLLTKAGVGLGNFSAMPDTMLYLTPSNPWDVPVKQNNDKVLSISTSTGRKKVSPRDYVDGVSVLKPHYVEALADAVPATAPLKRQRKAVHRSLAWLDACREHMKAGSSSSSSSSTGGGAPASSSSSPSPSPSSALLGVVVGGTDVKTRQISATETAKRDVAGFAIAGLGTGESDAVQAEVLRATMRCLPAGLPRFMSGANLPDQIIAAVAEGVDVLSSTHPLMMTEMGHGATFWPLNTCTVASDDKINLWDSRYKTDFTPIVPGCQCYTCRNHTRGYIHHLLNVHELLGSILLYTHNVYHFHTFFAGLRSKIADGTFGDLVKKQASATATGGGNEEGGAAEKASS